MNSNLLKNEILIFFSKGRLNLIQYKNRINNEIINNNNNEIKKF